MGCMNWVSCIATSSQAMFSSALTAARGPPRLLRCPQVRRRQQRRDLHRTGDHVIARTRGCLKNVGKGSIFAMHDTKVLGTQFSSSGRIRTYIYLRAPAAWTIPSHPVEVRAILFEKFVCGFSSSSSFAMMLRVCGEDSMDDNISVSNCTVVHVPPISRHFK